MIYSELGRLEQYRQNWQQARAMYNMALDYDPTNVIALNSMGLLLTQDSKHVSRIPCMYDLAYCLLMSSLSHFSTSPFLNIALAMSELCFSLLL